MPSHLQLKDPPQPTCQETPQQKNSFLQLLPARARFRITVDPQHQTRRDGGAHVGRTLIRAVRPHRLNLHCQNPPAVGHFELGLEPGVLLQRFRFLHRFKNFKNSSLVSLPCPCCFLPATGMMSGKERMGESLQRAEEAVAEDSNRGLTCTADFPESGEEANDVGGSSRGGGTKSSSVAADGAGSPPPDVSSINIEFSRPSKVAKSLDFDRMRQVGTKKYLQILRFFAPRHHHTPLVCPKAQRGSMDHASQLPDTPWSRHQRGPATGRRIGPESRSTGRWTGRFRGEGAEVLHSFAKRLRVACST